MALPSSPGCLPVTQRVLPCTRPHPFRDSQEDAHLTLPPSASSRCPLSASCVSPRWASFTPRKNSNERRARGGPFRAAAVRLLTPGLFPLGPGHVVMCFLSRVG